VDFTVNNWGGAGGNWGATVDGSGTVDMYDVDINGVAAGTVDPVDPTFSGTGAGVVGVPVYYH
jgi:hypothetical protein